MTSAQRYTVVPYEGGTYPQTHPDVLATVSSLVGLRPAPPSRCRVLEIGCADGANLLGMAAYLPGSTFVGIDAAANQLETGESLRAAAGLSNVTFHVADLVNPPELGQFDYVITHGVYSWVPEAVRSALLALCRRSLLPQGVAYVSYNTLPGWHAQRVICDLMRFHTRKFEDPADIIAQGRAIVDFAARASDSAFYQSHAAYLSVLPDDYLFHDHLAPDNQAFYLSEFVDRARAGGLQYVGDAELHRSLDLNFSLEVRARLQELTDNPVIAEQYLDFLTDRTLRRSLLCHADVSLTRSLDPEWVSRLSVGFPLTEVTTVHGQPGYHRPGMPEDLVVAQTPAQATILESLRRVWPGSCALRALPAEATELMVACALRGFAELRTEPSVAVRHGGPTPRVAALVRAQARRGLPLTNVRLQSVALSDPEVLALVARLDGTYTPSASERAVVSRLGRLGLLIG